MTEDQAGPSGQDSLKLIEQVGSIGTWNWFFSTGKMTWSQGLYDILGMDASAVEPDFALYNKILHPDDQLDITTPLAVVSNLKLMSRQFRIVRPNGELRWCHSHGRLIHTADGKPSHILGVIFDITETHFAFEAHKRLDNVMTAVRRLFDAVLWETAGDGTISNPMEWWRSTGLGNGRMIGWERLQFVHDEDRDMVREAWATAIRTKLPYSATYRGLASDGAYVTVLSRAMPVFNARDEIINWVGFTARHTPSLGTAPQTDSYLAPGALTPSLIRAARGYLDWTANELADKAEVSFSTIRRIETPGARNVREQSMTAVHRAFEQAGLRFVAAADGSVGIQAPST
jgi:PAS domain S-box-containing protein